MIDQFLYMPSGNFMKTSATFDIINEIQIIASFSNLLNPEQESSSSFYNQIISLFIKPFTDVKIDQRFSFLLYTFIVPALLILLTFRFIHPNIGYEVTILIGCLSFGISVLCTALSVDAYFKGNLSYGATIAVIMAGLIICFLLFYLFRKNWLSACLSGGNFTCFSCNDETYSGLCMPFWVGLAFCITVLVLIIIFLVSFIKSIALGIIIILIMILIFIIFIIAFIVFL